MTNDVDEGDSEGSVENDLKNRVDGDENGAVLVVTASKSSPNQHLMIGSRIHIWMLRSQHTMAIHLARPTRIKPSRSPLLSGKNAQESASCSNHELHDNVECEDCNLP